MGKSLLLIFLVGFDELGVGRHDGILVAVQSISERKMQCNRENQEIASSQ